MLYKLYRNEFEEEPPEERKEFFQQLYEKHNVKLIGVFHEKGNPLVKYMMTAYQDQDHYEEFVSAVKSIPRYNELTQEIDEVRISNEVIDLVRE